MNEEIIRVEDLKIHFPLKQTFWEHLHQLPPRSVKAVNGVSFTATKGETLGIVGESGCGKTTIGKALVKLNQATDGHIYFKGQDIAEISGAARKNLCKQIQYIFQDPFSSLNPQMTVMEIVRRPLDIFDLYDRKERDKRVLELLNMVGIASQQVYRFPHEFSGGQRQRISIARALAVQPEVLVADEPTSALDVSIQCQILDLLTELRKELGLTMIFISHDLGVVNYISDQVLIMYLGHVIERGNTRQVLRNPAHPYAKALLEALPVRAATVRNRKIRLDGYIPSPIDPPSGCLLHPRCPFAREVCAAITPQMQDLGDNHYAACLFLQENKSQSINCAE